MCVHACAYMCSEKKKANKQCVQLIWFMLVFQVLAKAPLNLLNTQKVDQELFDQ